MRRISAMLGILVIVGLVCILMWRVYLHHRQSGDQSDEPGVIAACTSAPSVARPLLSLRA
jgi:hypothetical protein